MTTAYKGFNQDLQGYGKFQYKVGETYELNGELKICKNGFHYCKRIVDIGGYYVLNKSRVCEVEILSNEVADNKGKFATNKIRIVRELSREEINKYFEDNWLRMNIG